MNCSSSQGTRGISAMKWLPSFRFRIESSQSRRLGHPSPISSSQVVDAGAPVVVAVGAVWTDRVVPGDARQDGTRENDAVEVRAGEVRVGEIGAGPHEIAEYQVPAGGQGRRNRSEEHTSEVQSL